MDFAAAAQLVSTWRHGCAGGHETCASMKLSALLKMVAASLPHSGAEANAAHAGVHAFLGVLADLSAVAGCPSYAQAFGEDADVAVLLLRLVAGTAVGAWEGDARARLGRAVAVVLRHASSSRPAFGAEGAVVEEVARLAARLHQLRVLQATQEVRCCRVWARGSSRDV
jgi:hypothetical protein